MNNLFDYLTWRGDISFNSVPICAVDYLIFCRLAYIPFDTVVPEAPESEPLMLAEAIRHVLEIMSEENHTKAYHQKEDETLLLELLKSARYMELKLTGYRNIFNAERQEQFCATTLILPDGKLVITFRGTDGTVIGWKEDFNLCFADVIPAQLEAVRYLEDVADKLLGEIILCGHSKGGNLAVYSGAFCRPELQNRIKTIRNIDGPGFNQSIIARKEFQKIIKRTKTYLPQSSIIGMLLEHEEDFTIVHSDKYGFSQHNVYLWEVQRGELVTAEEHTNSSRMINNTLKIWITEMEPELREKLVDGVFQIIASSDSINIRELLSGKNTLTMLRTYTRLDEETKTILSQAFELLKRSIKKSKPAKTPRKKLIQGNKQIL